MRQIQKWVSDELEFNARIRVNDIFEAEADLILVHQETKKEYKIPMFWDGGFSWKARYVLTELGAWDFTVKESGELALGIDGISGTVNCVEYEGDLDIYKHGFLKTEKDVRYFMYADGTPFFYLGDTHWNMVKEEFDSAGEAAGDIETDSHFKYIVDRRVEQGFTVYQSEPIGAKYNVDDGIISAEDIEGFKEFDKYFQYIAQKGLVHANAELVFPSSVNHKEFRDNVKPLTRYWIARYASYPVLWSLGQEVDDARNFAEGIYQTYRIMCEYISEIDPYKSPISAHQLNAQAVGVDGNVPVAPIDGGYNNYNPTQTERGGKTRPSTFKDVKGHTWWANQWRPVVDQQFNFGIPKDYWENGQKKPVVDYEARYHFLYGGSFCMRAQAWIGYMCFMGHAYGGADMWLYRGRYAMDSDAFDGVEVTTVQKKRDTNWSDLINAPISSELGYIKAFFESLEWWTLQPDFDYEKAFVKTKDGNYACLYRGDEIYTVYLYNRTVDSAGKLINMDKNATYTAKWYDTRTGKYSLISDSIKTNGEYDIPQKPVADDMVLLVTKN